jgi:pimeloyl-ACP methyl ester carboxylesterase
VSADPARREALRQTLANDHEVQLHADIDAARRALGAGTAVDAVLVDVGVDATRIEGFARWLALHRPDLADRTAFVAPAVHGAESRRALAGRRDRVLEADAEPDAVRRLVGRLVAA